MSAYTSTLTGSQCFVLNKQLKSISQKAPSVWQNFDPFTSFFTEELEALKGEVN